MTETTKPLHDQLADLERAAQAAGERMAVAQKRARAAGRSQVAYPARAGMMGDGPSAAGREVFAELADYRQKIYTNRPDAVAPEKRAEWERHLTDRIVSEIRERGLLFSPNADGWSVTLVDPSVVTAYDAAREEADEARSAARRFAKDNADALAADAEEASRGDFVQAIQAGDTEAVAGIIRLTADAQRRREDADAAMTTRDLPRGGADEEAERARARERFDAERDAENQRLIAEHEERERQARRATTP